MTVGPQDGKTVLVTGTGSGIGRATAHLLACAGATVIATDLRGHKETATAITEPRAGPSLTPSTSVIGRLGPVGAMITYLLGAGSGDVVSGQAIPLDRVGQPSSRTGRSASTIFSHRGTAPTGLR